ncbi:MAG: thiol peroxidase [Candidatus Cloacimonadota bacterium]|nr:thiol peroxidase [Candidatus Cloacimonadota bacterium]
MAEITLQGNKIHTIGDIPPVGAALDDLDFRLTKTDLSDVNIADFSGKKIVLNIFTSLDTDICAASVRKFNKEAAKFENMEVLCISRDLPFAHARFCTTEGLENVISLSEMRDSNFSERIGLRITDGPLAGLMARAVIVLDENLKVIYTELVPEIAQEPNYDEAIKNIKS